MDRRTAIFGLAGLSGAGAMLKLRPSGGSLATSTAPAAAAPTAVVHPGSGAIRGVLIRQVPLGGGGFVTGIDISDNGGRFVCRTDVANAYVRDISSPAWRPLFSPETMLASDYDPLPSGNDKADGQGVAGIRLAPSDLNVIYASYLGYIWRSTDGGRSIRRTSLPQKRMFANTGAQRLFNRTIEVHPKRPDTLIVGTHGEGAWLSNDGGQSWRKADLPPTATSKDGHPGVYLFAVDPRVNDRLYAFVTGAGLHVSDDFGQASFRALPGGPSACSCVIASSDGTIFVCEFTNGTGGSLWRYSSGKGWQASRGGREIRTLAIDPHNAKSLIGIDGDGFFVGSDDGGATLRNLDGGTWRTGGEVSWMSGLKTLYPSELVFDRSGNNRLFIAHGTGVAKANLQPSRGTLDLTDWSAGIEELCAVDAMVVPGGSTYFSALDLPFWKLKDQRSYTNDFRYPVVGGKSHDTSLVVPGARFDYAADDPNYLVGVVGISDRSSPGFSLDGGETWQAFATTPPSGWGYGGSIAAGFKRNIVLLPSNNGVGVYTLDGGKSWAPIKLDGVNPTAGFANAFYVSRKNVAADKTRPGVFALVYTVIENDQFGGPLGGLWVTSDGGATWRQTFKGVINSKLASSQELQLQQQDGRQFWGCQLEYVPGQTGELVYTPHADAPADRFFWSRDDGRTWSELHRDVRNVKSFGFGKATSGQPKPALYFWGDVKKKTGLYLTRDWFASPPELLTRFPSPVLASVEQVTGDLNVFGRAYVGTRCAGWVQIDVQT